MQRPRPVTTVFVAALLILSVVFFFELGDFREFGLEAAKKQGPDFGDPTFFTIAQILFLLASAVVNFAFVGRRTGRELRVTHEEAVSKHRELTGEAKELQTQADHARKAAAEAPAQRMAAEERIRSRERIADGNAKHDLKQGEYLESLVVPEYMRERAAVESGIYFWHFGDHEEGGNRLIGPVPAIIATLAAGGLAYWGMKNVLASIVIAAIVAAASALILAWRNGEGTPASQAWKYAAQMVAPARKASERATDIERLVPVDAAEPEQNGRGNGNGRRKRATNKELLERIEKVKEILDDEAK